MTRRRVLGAAAVVAVSAGLAACGGGSSTTTASDPATSATQAGGGGQSAENESLSVSVPLVTDVIDTTKVTTQALGLVLLGLEPLLLYQPDGSLRPNLAESYTQPRPTRYVFRLRRGVRFWDGTPLTATDVIGSFRAHYGEGSTSYVAQQWASVEGASAPDDQTVVVELSRPNPQFLYTVAQTGVYSAAYARRSGERLGTPGVLNMGTGPYRFASLTATSRMELERNEEYWGERPHVRRIDAQMLTNDARLLATQSGDLDAVIAIPISQVRSFEGVPELAITDQIDDSVYKFSFAMERAPWDDVHLRRAFAHAIDREAIASGIFGGGAEPTTTLVPAPVLETLVPASEVEAAYGEIDGIVPEFDLDKARAELAQSRSPDGVKTTLLVTASDPNLSAIAQTVAQSAAEVGIDIDVREVDDATYYTAVYLEHTTEGVGLDNYSADNPDPINIPFNVLDSINAKPQGSGVNSADYRNATVDRLLAENMALPADDPERGTIQIEIQRQAAADLPYAPIVFPKVYLGLDESLSYPQFDTFWWLTRWPDQIVARG